ncbi:MAG: DUF302 domain-containing protein [Leptolyngbya sp. DLM2.Bin27]|nr:MAG: DUF302 domain-containing protein [Leptolyngbya sp. DLM2.Bin27]
MYYIVETAKTVEQAAADLEQAVKDQGFGVLYVHDLGSTLRAKGVDFAEECQVFEVCNPHQAAKVMAADMRLNMVLPCRISVFSETGTTKIGLVKPVPMLMSLVDSDELTQVAHDVEAQLIAMVDGVK